MHGAWDVYAQLPRHKNSKHCHIASTPQQHFALGHFALMSHLDLGSYLDHRIDLGIWEVTLAPGALNVKAQNA